MSHQPQRKEKDCLNCGTIVYGRYCHICGQENIVIKQSFLSLTKHFIYDIFHFDGKFFDTLKYLFTRPGFVAKKFVEGKRVSYLDPIRMYLFTSAIFFLVFFSVKNFNVSSDLSGELSYKERNRLTRMLQKKLKKDPYDTLAIQQMQLLQDTSRKIGYKDLGLKENKVISFTGTDYNSLNEYDSIQKSLPEAKRDGWIGRSLIRQSIVVNEKYGSSKEGTNQFVSALLHKLPYLLFVSLPFFALLLKLLYIRRKGFLYSDHAVFTLYHYVFTFILLLLVFTLDFFKGWTGWGLLGWMTTILYICWPVYLYIQMKNFYGQGHGKTLIKFILLNFSGLMVLVMLMFIFLLFSIFQL